MTTTRDGGSDPAFDPTDPAAYRHWLEERVRYSDLDTNGHANNGAVTQFFEASRVAIFETVRAKIDAIGGLGVIVKLGVEFRRELHYEDRIRIGGRIAGLGTSSVRFANAIFRDDVCAATSDAVCVILNAETRRAMPLPPDLRDAVLRWA